MIKNTFGESLIGIIIGVFILSFILLGVTNLLINSKTLIETYENKKTISILKNNTERIIENIDTGMINETEIFYLYKNNSTKNYEIFTGAVNDAYQYIDQYGDKINDLNTFEGNIYSRTLELERDDNIIGENHQTIKINITNIINNYE